MFDQASKGRVWWPVDFQQYDESGEVVTQRLMLLFEPLTRAERKAIRVERLAAVQATIAGLSRDKAGGGDEAPLHPMIGDAETAGVDATTRVLNSIEENFQATELDLATVAGRTHDWRAKQGEEAVPFDRSYLVDLMQSEAVARTILAAFNECCEGAVRKNSAPGHAGKPAPAQA